MNRKRKPTKLSPNFTFLRSNSAKKVTKLIKCSIKYLVARYLMKGVVAAPSPDIKNHKQLTYSSLTGTITAESAAYDEDF